jgi:hypothetical protein
MGPTEVDACRGLTEADCFALKRPGGPLEAKLKVPDEPCDLACVLILAGGVHRALPAGTKVVLTSMVIRNRVAPNVSKDARIGATTRYDELFRIYLRDMGIETELLDIVDQTSEVRRRIELPPSEWMRLHIVTATSL